MNVFDILLVALPVALFLLGYVRGAWRELLSLAGVTAGAVLGAKFHHMLATQIIRVFADRDFASLVAYIVFVLAGYFIGGFLGGFADHQTRTHAPASG
ncbi:MAG TPA: CvpA family protein, partial [bacterium]